MNTVELQTFSVVAELGSVTAAAQRLHLTQPAVSKRIQSLEGALHTQLFDRVGKQMQLTQAGRLFQSKAQSMLSLWADTEKELLALTDEVAGSLTIATSHHIGLHRLAPVLKSFTDLYPKVHLNLSFEDSEVAHAQVQEGMVELAVATLDPEGRTSLEALAIWDDPLVFVSLEAATVSLTELANLNSVLPGTTTYTGRIVLERFRSAGIPLQATMSTNYLETLSMLVSVGLGWSVLPKSMVGELAILEVDTAPMQRTLGAVYDPERVISNAARAFLDTLSQYQDSATDLASIA